MPHDALYHKAVKGKMVSAKVVNEKLSNVMVFVGEVEFFTKDGVWFLRSNHFSSKELAEESTVDMAKMLIGDIGGVSIVEKSPVDEIAEKISSDLKKIAKKKAKKGKKKDG